MRAVVANGLATRIGALADGKTLRLDIVLPLQRTQEAQSLLTSLYQPGNPNFHHYLSVQQFTDRFAPSQADYDAVVAFTKANGMTVKALHANRLVLSVEAPVAAVNTAFGVTMTEYQHPMEKRRFYAPDREPAVKAGIKLWGIDGLDDFSIDHRASAPGSAPGGLFSGLDARAAYGVAGLTGAGQVIGLRGGQFRIEDVRQYFNTLNLPFHAGSVETISVDGSSTDCPISDDCGEVAIDVEQALSTAPGVDKVIVYEGNHTAGLARMAGDNIAKQFSTSITWTPADQAIEDPLFIEMVMQGQTYFAATGDHGSFGPGVCVAGGAQHCAQFPSEDWFVTAVGGTKLTATGPGGAWASETAWGGGGGGPSTDGVPIPPYQLLPGVINTANEGSMVLRNLPDVAGHADGNNYFCASGHCSHTGGTSFASPRWAGLMALINEQAAQNGLPSIGWFNPLLYPIGAGLLGSYAQDFHDITQGNNDESDQQLYNAVAGYDLATGWGSANGQNLANDLAGIAACYPDYVPAISIAVGYPAGSQVSLNQQNYTASTRTFVSPAGNNGPPGSGKAWITPNVDGFGLCGPLAPLPPPLEDRMLNQTQVNLAAFFNATGVFLDGQVYVTNGLDSDGFAYSRTTMGTIQDVGSVAFTIGNAALYNAVRAVGQTISLPSGSYTGISMLATAANGAQAAQTFTMLYADGTTSTVTQSLSDWANSSAFSGESISVSMPYRDTEGGQAQSVPVNLYGYELTADGTKTLTGIQLPDNSNVIILALTEVNHRKKPIVR